MNSDICNKVPKAVDDCPAECWKEGYRGDSRKFVFSDGSGQYDTQACSVTRETFQYPIVEEPSNLGARKTLILKKLHDAAATEVMREGNKQPPEIEYCTEYDSNFNNTEQAKKINYNEELALKHPLYTSSPVSYWNYKIGRTHCDEIHVLGLTKSTDLQNPFKRNANFSKPISEVLDESYF